MTIYTYLRGARLALTALALIPALIAAPAAAQDVKPRMSFGAWFTGWTPTGCGLSGPGESADFVSLIIPHSDPVDALVIIDPQLEGTTANDLSLTIDGKAAGAAGLLVPGDGQNQATAVFLPGQGTLSALGKSAVTIRINYKGQTMFTETIDVPAAAVSDWRACAAGQ